MEQFIYKKLEALSDKSYQQFNAKLIPNVDNILGVRTPQLRKLAKELYKDPSFDVDKFLALNSSKYLEFTMLQGFLIGLKKSSINEFLNDIKNFVPKINNWAVCDGFCASIKQTKLYHNEVWNFLQHYLNSTNEYELRFGVVMLLNYFITENYIDKTLEILITRTSKDYYAQMAIAWALSICYVKFFDKTHAITSTNELDKEILTKTVRKVCESLQPTKEHKITVKTLLLT